MKRILITGGAGFIGSHCVDLFLANGYEVGVFDIKSVTEAVHLTHCMDAITYIEGDIRNHRQLDSAVTGYDHILHLAAIVSVQESIENPLESHDTNVTGTLNVFSAAVTHSVDSVVYASSAAVYGDTQTVPTPESTPLKPLSPYGLHKVVNEQYAELFATQYALPSTGFRFFNVYGSRQDPSSPYSGVISLFHKYMLEGKQPTVYGDGSATRDFIHVHDVAQMCVKAIENSKKGASVYNVGTGKATSIQTLIKDLNMTLDTNIEPIIADPREGDIVHSCAVVTAVQTDFSIQEPTEIEDGLQELMKSV